MSFTHHPIRSSPGAIFRRLVAETRSPPSTHTSPLPILGTPNAYSALLAVHAGAKAIYLSGSSLSTVGLGLPDLGVITAHDVAEETRRITSCCSLPLLVDIDTGLSNTALGIRRTLQMVERSGACGVHIEDQRIDQKRCGHRPNKSIVSITEMTDRIHTAATARDDPSFVIMARTDALASSSLSDTITRAKAYVAAGADMMFVEAATSLSQYSAMIAALGPDVPVLANVTEWGVSPAWSVSELGEVGVAMALYPVSAQRAMAWACLRVYDALLRDGSVKGVMDQMQTRREMYDVLGYDQYEREADDRKQVKPTENTKETVEKEEQL